MRIASPFPGPLLALFASLALCGCIARTAADVVTAPIKLGSKAVDLATTSQSEADEKRGREMRKREERLGKLGRRYDKQIEKCREGDARSCEDSRETSEEMTELRATLPAEPEDD